MRIMRLYWEHATKILDQITKTNQGWHTREVDKLVDTYIIGAFSEQRDLDKIMDQEVAQPRTKIGLLTKQFVAVREKM